MEANFGAPEFYSGGRMLPEGNYSVEFIVKNHQAMKNDGTPFGQPRLGVMGFFTPIDAEGNPTGEPLEQFTSMGTKAHLSWGPDPTTGKGLTAIPGGQGIPLTDKSNWFLFMKSMWDCGAPGFGNDISAWDGVHVHTSNQPEPEERKGFAKAATGEAQEEERRGNGLIVTVSEILDTGKPWEGTVAPKKAAPKAAVKPGVKPAAAKAGPVAAAKPAAVAAPPAGDDLDESVKEAAENAFAEILGNAPAGLMKLKLRTETFKYVKSNNDEDTATAVLDSVFSNDDTLASLLGPLGYKLDGNKVAPQK